MSTELPVRHTNILLCSSYSLRRNSESLLLPESPGSPLELSLPFGCNLYSTSANSERKQQKFLHRRLRGVHIPASRNACRVSKGDPNSLNDLILSSLAEIHVAPSSAPGSMNGMWFPGML